MKRRYFAVALLATGTLFTLVGCAGNYAPPGSDMADRLMPRGEMAFCEPADVFPVRVRGRAPLYPVQRFLEREEGSTELTFTVDETGKAVNFMDVMSTHPAFFTSAKMALQEWEIEPARNNDVPVAVECRFQMRFMLKNNFPD